MKLTLFVFTLVVALPAYAQLDSLPTPKDEYKLIRSKRMNEDRTIWIHLPAEYHAGTDAYPVLYLMDGGSHFSYVSAMADYLSGFEANVIGRMIVVGILNTDRQRDFTVGADNLLGFLREEVIPLIDKSYRTQPYRVLEGHSLGGRFALHANIKAPELFQSTIIISPAISGNGDEPNVLKDLVPFLKRKDLLKKKWYITLGEEGPHGTDTLTYLIRKYGPKTLASKFKKYEEENHFSIPFKSMYDGLRYIYSTWPLPVFLNPKPLSYQDIEAHYKKISDDLGYAVKPSEDVLNQAGYQQLNFGNVTQAVDIFLQNVLAHPNSWNAYDSLGEGYMVQGNREQAIINYEKSITLNPKNANGIDMLRKLRAVER